MSDTFSFKQFEINQKEAAMKIGIDAVLFGSWMNTNTGTNILDIGTGTGILALMAAQKNPKAYIEAIDIEKDAVKCANLNIKNSKFADRIHVYHSSLQRFTPKQQYDTIITNPPFYSNGIKPSDSKRAIARHTKALTLYDLFHHSKTLLQKDGILQLILPNTVAKEAIEMAEEMAFWLIKKCMVMPVREKAANRVMLCFSLNKGELFEENIVIREKDNTYSTQFKQLTNEFYL